MDDLIEKDYDLVKAYVKKTKDDAQAEKKRIDNQLSEVQAQIDSNSNDVLAYKLYNLIQSIQF